MNVKVSNFGMAINSTTYVLNHRAILESHGCDEELEEIIGDVNYYLYQFSQSWMFYFAYGYYFKCYRSWLSIRSHLEIFLRNPKANYSMIMFLLEHEIARFPPNSFYCTKLKALAQLIATGPNFYLYILFPV